MAVAFLDFEQPIAELEAKIEELRHVTSESEVNIKDEISRLQAKSRQLTRNIFANLTPWQITQLARHPQRPDPAYFLEQIHSEDVRRGGAGAKHQIRRFNRPGDAAARLRFRPVHAR